MGHALKWRAGACPRQVEKKNNGKKGVKKKKVGGGQAGGGEKGKKEAGGRGVKHVIHSKGNPAGVSKKKKIKNLNYGVPKQPRGGKKKTKPYHRFQDEKEKSKFGEGVYRLKKRKAHRCNRKKRSRGKSNGPQKLQDPGPRKMKVGKSPKGNGGRKKKKDG